MCTVVILNRPGHDWPVLIAANRDEMVGRSWRSPARHWPDRVEVTAGLDEVAGGTWLGLNDWGVAAGVMNRVGTLGSKEGFRSRGELPLEALDHAEAQVAIEALSHLNTAAWRPFNMVIADPRTAFWLRSDSGAVKVERLPPGLSMVTAYDRNDLSSPRIRRYLPLFEAASVPDPEGGDWSAWQALLARRDFEADADRRNAMCVETEEGFATVSSSLIALPAPGRPGAVPVWLFAPGRPGEAAYGAVKS